MWLQSLLATHSANTVFLCITGTDELFTAINSLDAISRVSTIRRIVYRSIIGDFTSETGFTETVRICGYPHLFAKVLMEQRLKHEDFAFEWTVLGPTLFFSNDEMQKSSLLENSYLGSPVSKRGMNMISPSDIALAARNVMYDSAGSWHRKKIQLGSFKFYTGSEIKNIWSRALNKPLEGFFATPERMEEWEQQSRQFVQGDYGKAWGRDLRILFEFLISDGMGIVMSKEDYEEQVALLGKEPDDYGGWVRSTADAWLQE